MGLGFLGPSVGSVGVWAAGTCGVHSLRILVVGHAVRRKEVAASSVSVSLVGFKTTGSVLGQFFEW